jgi:protein-L-isoaspartate(D-aspartate) O-methyltransferase
MTAYELEWGLRHRSLVDALRAAGQLRDPARVAAFIDTPRHIFVPQVILPAADGYRVIGNEPEQRTEWLSIVYSDESLVIQHKPHAAGYTLPNGQPVQVPTSSSTMPSLMARMLETLDLRKGHRVLEIGTGTGYNAALLAHRLGSSSVVSIDIDPDLIDGARERLAELGRRPTLIAGDGLNGAPDHGPYDRIIATAATPHVPSAWIEQLAPGGKILANIRGDLFGGAMCLLTKESADDEVIGPLLPIGGHSCGHVPRSTIHIGPMNPPDRPPGPGYPAPQHTSTPPISSMTRASGSCCSSSCPAHNNFTGQAPTINSEMPPTMLSS